jgi:hypothetical protein
MKNTNASKNSRANGTKPTVTAKTVTPVTPVTPKQVTVIASSPALDSKNLKQFLVVSFSARMFSLSRVNKSESLDLQERNRTENQKATNKLFHHHTDEKGKSNQLCLELEKIITLQKEAENYVKGVTIPIDFSSSYILPLDKFQIFDNKMSEFNTKLSTLKHEFINALPDLIAKDKKALANGFDSGLYKSGETYLSQIAIKIKKVPVDNNLIDEDFINEIVNERHKIALEPLKHAFKSINDYITGDAKKFTQNSIDNIVSHCKLAKELEILPDPKFDSVLDNTIKFFEGMKAEHLRHETESGKKSLCQPTIDKITEAVKIIEDNMSMFT